MKSLDKMIKERLYAEVYEVLATDNFVYSYENLQKAFPKAGQSQILCKQRRVVENRANIFSAAAAQAVAALSTT